MATKKEVIAILNDWDEWTDLSYALTQDTIWKLLIYINFVSKIKIMLDWWGDNLNCPMLQ